MGDKHIILLFPRHSVIELDHLVLFSANLLLEVISITF